MGPGRQGHALTFFVCCAHGRRGGALGHRSAVSPPCWLSSHGATWLGGGGWGKEGAQVEKRPCVASRQERAWGGRIFPFSLAGLSSLHAGQRGPLGGLQADGGLAGAGCVFPSAATVSSLCTVQKRVGSSSSDPQGPCASGRLTDSSMRFKARLGLHRARTCPGARPPRSLWTRTEARARAPMLLAPLDCKYRTSGRRQHGFLRSEASQIR